MKRTTIRPNINLLALIFLLPVSLLLAIACKKKDNFTPYMPVIPVNNDSVIHKGTIKYLALGDSYTIGTSVAENDRYPVQTVDILKNQGIAIDSADIIATNGWTTADLANGISISRFANSYDAVSLLIGVNNQYQGRSIEEYKSQFTSLLERAIQFAKGKPGHVIVLSIPDYSVTPFAGGSNKIKIAAEIDAFNDVNQTVTAAYHAQYLYITDESRKAANDLTLVAADGLHFSGKEYSIWAGKLAPMIKALAP
jgi:lysophospholipase L1-like esterase